MLQSVDTLIAFVVIMPIVSLFVTIVVQMVSAALSLRGKNLANALALTFQTIDPALAQSAHQLAARILSDPILSDSTQTDKDRHASTIPERTEPWGFRNCLRGATKLANAIRPGEVYGALKNLAAGFDQKSPATFAAEGALAAAQADFSKAGTPAEKVAATGAIALAKTALANCRMQDSRDFQTKIETAQSSVKTAQAGLANAKGTDSEPSAKVALDAAQNALDTLYDASLPGAAQRLLAGIGTPAEAASLAADKLSSISALSSYIAPQGLTAFNAALSTTSAHLVALIDAERGEFEDWFNSAQDRAQQWFQFHTRGVTVTASILVVLLFQLDAVEVFHYVSTNSAARAALVASADKVIKEGSGILENKNDLIERINNAWDHTPARLTGDELNGVVNTYELQKRIAAKASPGSTFDPTVFNATVIKVAESYNKEQSDKISYLTGAVSATGYALIPTGGWRWPTIFPAGKYCEWWEKTKTYWSHGFGMVLFSGLLSLGAPYWYNLLKNLASLRPALAQLIGAEDVAKTQAKK